MRKRILSRLIALALIPLILAGLAYGLHRKARGFSIHKISTELSYEEGWDVAPPSPEKRKEIKQILSQKFTYLGDGTQAYAFESEDKRYVLKFFKMKHLLPKIWLNYLPLPDSLEEYRYKKVDRRMLRRYEMFSSHKLAFEELGEESGLVFVHLNPSRKTKKKVLLVDANGKEHRIDLDRIPFIIQKRAELLYVRLAKLKEKGDHVEMRHAIRSFLKLVEKRCQKGFADKDKGISNNYGFVGDTVIQIDIGEVVVEELQKDPSNVQCEVERVAKKLEYWILHHAPEYLQDLQSELKQFF